MIAIIIFTIAAGCALPVQTAMNSRLRAAFSRADRAPATPHVGAGAPAQVGGPTSPGESTPSGAAVLSDAPTRSGQVGEPSARRPSTRRTALQAAVGAALVAFIIGSLTLALIALARGLPLTVAPHTPLWAFSGGLLGATALVALILLFPHIGATGSVILPLIGKIAAGVLIDSQGWFESLVRTMSLPRLLGVIAVLLGIYLAIAAPAGGRRRSETASAPTRGAESAHTREATARTRTRSAIAPVYLLLGAGVGVLSAVQTAVNGRLTVAMGSSISSGLISYSTSTVFLLLLLIALRWRPRRIALAPWWMWLGGPLGAAFVVGLASAAPEIGTGPAILVALCGQITASAAIDHFGWFGTHSSPLTAEKLCGAVLVAAGMWAYSLL